MTNVLVCALSQLACRGRRVAPPRARSGRPLSAVQTEVCSRLMGLSRLIRRPPLTLGGRGAAKLNSLYGYTDRVQATAPGGTCRPPAALVGGDFNAARAEFLNAPALFDPAPHLGPFEAACFLEPRLLEVPRDPCPHPVGGLRCQRAEILKFVRKLDAAGRLHLATPAEAPRDQRMNLIAVPKNEAVDRIVWDRRRRNWLEAHLVGGARDLPAGYLFTDHEVGDGEVMRLFADDLQDFYPSVVSSAARACTNALAIELTADELAGLRAMRRFGGSPPPRLVPCARSLVMGDVNASDWATEAHAKILGEAGAMPAEKRVLHGKPYPRGPVAQALAIDDHVAIANVPLAAGARPVAAPASAPRPRAMSLATATPMPPAVATPMPPSASPSDDVRACFERAGGAYARAGLHRHPAKQRRAEAQGTALGAEILGDAGHIASERLRRLRLADLSLRIATGRYSTGALLRAVVSSWIFVLLFRRPLLCLLWECFRALPDLAGGAAADSVVFELPAAVRQELVVLAAMAPAMTSNVRAHPSSTLLATDASDDAIAAVRAPISQELHRELWRVRDRKGWPTHLLGRHGEWLHARGSDRDRADLGESLHAELLQAQACDPERSLVEYFDVMEVFTGPRGPFLQACSRQGLRVGPLIDLQLSAAWDLSEGRLMEWLLFLIQAQRVLYIHFGPPCTSFSLARRPALRSRAFPFGFRPSGADHAQGEPTPPPHSRPAHRRAALPGGCRQLGASSARSLVVRAPRAAVPAARGVLHAVVLDVRVWMRVPKGHQVRHRACRLPGAPGAPLQRLSQAHRAAGLGDDRGLRVPRAAVRGVGRAGL